MSDPSPSPSPSPATPRRVLLLSRGGALDGEQRQLCYLAANLDRQLYEPCALLDHDGPCAEELRRHGIDCAILPTRDTRRFPDMLLRSIDARRALQQAQTWGIHLVHASNRWKSHYAFHIARHMKIPAVMHVRGPMSRHDVAKHGFHKASAIICISRRYQQDLLEMKIPAQRLHVVDDAVDSTALSPDPAGRQRLRHEWNLDAHFAIGLVGRLEPFKKILEFLQTISLLPASFPCLALVAGEPGPAHYMRQLQQATADLNLQHRVRFLGRRNDIRQTLSALDLLVSLSGGSVIYEAMACGTPVLSVRDHPHSVHARHNQTAWCLKTQPPPEIANAIHHLLSDAPLRHRLATTARNWCTTHLSPSTLAAKTQAAYMQVVLELPTKCS